MILRVSAEKDTVWILLFRMLSPMIAIVFFMIILSVLLAFFSTKTIMKPINQLDPENPDDRNIYDEMKPFVRRLIFQNQQIHRQMDQLQEEHKKQDAIRREFTANVSHELKTPLTSISGFAEIIRDGYVQQKDISHFADNIHKEAQRMIVLVNDILKLSKLESGSFEIQNKREEVDLCAVCAGIRERLTLNAEKQGVSISCYSEDAEIRIMGIANLIDEIIYNICDNAIKYNRIGGFVKIRIRREREHSEVLVEIADNGIGIPEHFRAHLALRGSQSGARHGRTEEAIPAQAGFGPMARRVRPHRTQRRYRCFGSADRCHAGRRRLYHQRHQDFHYQRRIRRRVHRLRHDRQEPRHEGHHGLYPRKGHEGLQHRQEGVEDGYPRLGHLRIDF